jgi:adenylyltransferase/sulfurtransferase
MMDDEQLLRYSRQIMLAQIGIEGQQKLLEAHAVVIGLGGLGSPAAMYLAAAGVGRLTLVDFDAVDLSNLQRQIAHRSADIGRPKVESARDTLLALNPQIRVDTLQQRLDEAQMARLFAAADVVIDGSDNFATRFAVNAACVARHTPLVSGAAIRMEGQVGVFLPENPDSPCYRCLFHEDEEPDQRCSDTGVLSPVVGIIGSLQATEAIKVITGSGTPLVGRWLLLDALTMQWREIRLRKDPECPVCGRAASRRADS